MTSAERSGCARSTSCGGPWWPSVKCHSSIGTMTVGINSFHDKMPADIKHDFVATHCARSRQWIERHLLSLVALHVASVFSGSPWPTSTLGHGGTVRGASTALRKKVRGGSVQATQCVDSASNAPVRGLTSTAHRPQRPTTTRTDRSLTAPYDVAQLDGASGGQRHGTPSSVSEARRDATVGASSNHIGVCSKTSAAERPL